MDNAQVSLANILIMALWCIIVPCLSAAVYLFFSKSNKDKSMQVVRRFFIISAILLLVVGVTTFKAQAINPLCSGVGIPDQQFCVGQGLVSSSKAAAITSNKMLSDLARTVGIPVVVSLCVGLIGLSTQYGRKAGLEIREQ
jgi:hypothetical protein